MSSLNVNAVNAELSASNVVTALFCEPKLNVPAAPCRFRVGAVITPVCVTVPPAESRVIEVVAVAPATTKPPLSLMVAVSELVMATVLKLLLALFKVMLPPVPATNVVAPLTVRAAVVAVIVSAVKDSEVGV